MLRTGRVGNPEVHIPAQVIRALSWVAVLGLIGSFVLVLLAITSRYELDAVKATLITGFMGLGSGAGIALGSILATTGKPPTPDPEPPTPVEVVNTPADPVPTSPTTPVDPGYVSEFTP